MEEEEEEEEEEGARVRNIVTLAFKKVKGWRSASKYNVQLDTLAIRAGT